MLKFSCFLYILVIYSLVITTTLPYISEKALSKLVEKNIVFFH